MGEEAEEAEEEEEVVVRVTGQIMDERATGWTKGCPESQGAKGAKGTKGEAGYAFNWSSKNDGCWIEWSQSVARRGICPFLPLVVVFWWFWCGAARLSGPRPSCPLTFFALGNLLARRSQLRRRKSSDHGAMPLWELGATPITLPTTSRSQSS